MLSRVVTVKPYASDSDRDISREELARMLGIKPERIKRWWIDFDKGWGAFVLYAEIEPDA